MLLGSADRLGLCVSATGQSMYVCCRFWTTKENRQIFQVPVYALESNKLWNSSLERCNPKNNNHFLCGIVTTKCSECFKKVAPIWVQSTHTQYLCSLSILRSDKSKASIDGIIATADRGTYECVLEYFHSIHYSSFTLTQRVKVFDANQVDSISIVTPAYVLYSLLRYCYWCFFLFWCNDSFMSEQYWRTMMIMKSSQVFCSSFSSLTWNFHRNFVLKIDLCIP